MAAGQCRGGVDAMPRQRRNAHINTEGRPPLLIVSRDI
jgi:hypothetical protein